MKAINQACFKLEEKATRNVKKDKNTCFNIIKDELTIGIT